MDNETTDGGLVAVADVMPAPSDLDAVKAELAATKQALADEQKSHAATKEALAGLEGMHSQTLANLKGWIDTAQSMSRVLGSLTFK